MKYLILATVVGLVLITISLTSPVWSQDGAQEKYDHSHAKEKDEHAHSDDHEGAEKSEEGHDDHKHDEHAGEGDHNEHGEAEGAHEHEEEAANVGPEKGILAADEDRGFKLSPEALKNFEIKSQALSVSQPWTLPLSAQFLSGEEVNLYRLRDGFFKRIDFKLIKRSSDGLTISSESLKPGDEIVTHGVGFLRIAELAAFGGVADGHSH